MSQTKFTDEFCEAWIEACDDNQERHRVKPSPEIKHEEVQMLHLLPDALREIRRRGERIAALERELEEAKKDEKRLEGATEAWAVQRLDGRFVCVSTSSAINAWCQYQGEINKGAYLTEFIESMQADGFRVVPVLIVETRYD